MTTTTIRKVMLLLAVVAFLEVCSGEEKLRGRRPAEQSERKIQACDKESRFKLAQGLVDRPGGRGGGAVKCGDQQRKPEIFHLAGIGETFAAVGPPTSKPTLAPTKTVTGKPTELPTKAPTTPRPSPVPDPPTDPPTNPPTDPPTNAPTAEPTDAPKMLTILDVQAGLNKWVSLQGGPTLRATQDTVNTLNSVTSSMSLYRQMTFLANAIWESGGLRFTEEQAAVEFPYSTKSNYQRCDWNTNEQASNGKNFYGRGYMQLSWCANYKAYGRDRMVKNDADYFYNNPETVATTYAWDSAAWFFDTNVSDNSGNFGLTTQAINGNLECMSSNNYIGSVPQKRYQIFEALAAQVGLTGYAEGGCYN